MVRKNSIFIVLSLILLMALGWALLTIPKGELHWLLCHDHTPAKDLFFRYYTHIAEWLPYVICVAILLFSNIGNGVLATSCMVGSALTTQLFKHIINAPRPLTWFTANMPDIQLPLVDGVQMNYWFSFPSGHTTSFFALFFAISIIATDKISRTTPPIPCPKTISALIQILLFALAALGGYSRIYLSQHFAADIFGGIVVGLLLSVASYAILYRYKDQKWYNYRVFAKK